MNRTVLWLLNAVLLVVACGVTAWVVGQTPPPASADGKGDAKSARPERKSDRKAVAKEAEDVGAQQGVMSTEDVDVLWQQTLFRAERTEDVTQAPVEDAAAAAQPIDLELVGLARIGERAVAVIVQYRGQPPRRPTPGPVPVGAAGRSPVRRTPPARPAVPSPVASAAEGAPEGPPDRHVYKEGDKVGDSGYTLKEIRLKGKEVVLVRGSEERILKLDDTDDQSANRREVAANLAAQAAQAAQAHLAKAAAAARPPAEGAAPGAPQPAGEAEAGTPPPPPPAPGGEGAPGAEAPAVPGAVVPAAGVAVPAARSADGTPVVPMSREERLARARLLRERILQGRAPTNTTN
jgi:hypothetical protein